MTVFIRPATPAFDASGTPFSQEFADVYHSAASGPGQARHVFLHGNNLPERWRGKRVFTVLETGFGLGLNFLSTWSAWRADAARSQCTGIDLHMRRVWLLSIDLNLRDALHRRQFLRKDRKRVIVYLVDRHRIGMDDIEQDRAIRRVCLFVSRRVWQVFG